jgi:hypothetical protein
MLLLYVVVLLAALLLLLLGGVHAQEHCLFGVRARLLDDASVLMWHVLLIRLGLLDTPTEEANYGALHNFLRLMSDR